MAGNRVATGCISPVARNLLEFAVSTTGEVSSLGPQSPRRRLVHVLWDRNQSEKHRIYAQLVLRINNRLRAIRRRQHPRLYRERSIRRRSNSRSTTQITFSADAD